MPFTFHEYLRKRDPSFFNEVDELGPVLADPNQRKAFIDTLQKNKVNVKQAIVDAKANAGGKADKVQQNADRQLQNQIDMQNGKMAIPGVKKSDVDATLGVLTATGLPNPNEIGRGPAKVDMQQTLTKMNQVGALPQDPKLPSYLNIKLGKSPLNTVVPKIDPKNTMIPTDKAKAMSQPKTGMQPAS